MPLIQWAIDRLSNEGRKEGTPCVFATATDEARLRSALGGSAAVPVHIWSGETRTILRVAQDASAKRILLIDMTAALLPQSALGMLMAEHRARRNDATWLARLPCGCVPFLMELDALSKVASDASGQLDQMAAVSRWLENSYGPASTAQPFKAQPLHLFPAAEQATRHWPYHVQLDWPEDIRLLRDALALTESADSTGPLDTWTTARRQERQKQLSAPASGTTRVAESTAARVLVAQVPSAYSGAERVLELLASHCTVYSGRSFEMFALLSRQGFLSDRLAAAGVHVRIAERDFGRASLDNYVFCRREVGALLPSLAHVHSYCGIPLCISLCERSTPIVQHIHVASEEELGPLAEQLSFASKIVAVSAFVKDRLIRLGLEPQAISVVRNGVAHSMSERSRTEARLDLLRLLELPQSARLIVMPARFAPNKRHDIALLALASLRRTRHDAYLLLPGDVSGRNQPLVVQLKKRAASLGVTENVRLLGFWRDMDTLYSGCDALLLPSEDDPLPMTVLEAMAARLPVVAARSGGIPEMITHGDSGLLAEPGNAEEFSTHLSRMLHDSRFSDSVATSAFMRCQSEFSISRCAQDVLRVYADVRGSRNTPLGVMETGS